MSHAFLLLLPLRRCNGWELHRAAYDGSDDIIPSEAPTAAAAEEGAPHGCGSSVEQAHVQQLRRLQCGEPVDVARQPCSTAADVAEVAL